MKTFFMIKPDGVKRNIIGDVVNRVEKKDFVITKMKMMQISTELAEKHYEGDNAVLAIRELMGATNPADADPGTIRGDLASKLEENVVHGSDSEESAERELGLFFS